MAQPGVCSTCGVPLESGATAVLCPKCIASTETLQNVPPIRETVDLPPRSSADEQTLRAGESLSGERSAALKSLGVYQIVRQIGKGGFGLVYEAVDTRLKRRVALKVMRSGEDSSEQEVRRFRLEAESAAKLKHPNLVPIFDVGRISDLDFFTMDFIDGDTLGAWLRKKERSFRERARMLERIAEGIQHAHEHGIIHRDLKPGNVMVDSDGEPHVMDFGLAKDLGSDSSLSQSGCAMGTPAYMPPEQAEGRIKDIGPRSDIYSMGAIMYEMLVGRPPFTGENMMQVLRSACNDDPLPPRQIDPKIPADLETICLKCLAKRPERRYASATSLAADLRAFRDGDHISARPPTLFERGIKRWRKNPAAYTVGTAAAILLIVGTAAFVYSVDAERRTALKARADAQTERDRALKAEAEAKEHRRATENALTSERTARDAERKAEALRAAEEKKRIVLEQELGEANKREWHLEFEDDFTLDRMSELAPPEPDIVVGDAPDTPKAPDDAMSRARRYLESRWRIIGKWELKDGELRTFGEGYRWMILKQKFPGEVRIEFDCHQPGPALNDLSVFFNCLNKDPWPMGSAPGYQMQYCGWGNKQHEVRFDNRHLLEGKANTPLVANRRYHVRAERVGTRLTMSVDDKIVLDATDDKPPLLGPDHVVAGLFIHGAEIYYDNVRVYRLGPPRKVDVMELADDHLRRGNCEAAAALYQDVLESTNDPLRIEQAQDGKARAIGARESANYEAKLKAAWPDIKFKLQLKDYGLSLDVSGTALADLSVLRGMSLAELNINNTKVKDLSPLKELPLASLSCASIGLQNLEPLRGMKLRKLDCKGNGAIKDLAPLRGMPLKWLALQESGVTSLEPLTGMKLTHLEFWGNPVASLEPLRGMPLSEINLRWSKVDDLTPLKDAPLRTIDLDFVPRRDAQFLRGFPTLGSINGVAATEFWASDMSSQIHIVPISGNFAGGVAYFSDGKRIISSSCGPRGDNGLHVWEIETGKELKVMKGHTNYQSGLVLLPDNRRVLSAAYDKTIRLWDIESGKEIKKFPIQKGEVTGLAVDADGKQALSGCQDMIVRLWDVEEAREIRTFEGHTKRVWGVAFSPDGKSVYSGSEDGTFRIWNRETGAQLFSVETKSAIQGIAISKDGKFALAGGSDGTVRVIDLEKNSIVRLLKGHTKKLWGIALTPDGKRAVTGSEDTSVRLWNVETGEQIKRYMGHSGPVGDIAISPNGRQALSGGNDRTIRMWVLPD